MIHFKIVIFVFIILFAKGVDNSFYSQNKKNDSLKVLLKKDIEDTNKVNHLYKIGLEYLNGGDYDTALIYSNTILQLAQKLNYLKGIADAYNLIGICYTDQGNYEEALQKHFLALTLREKIQDKKGIASSYNNIGNIYHELKRYQKALDNHFLSLKFKKEIDDKKGMCTSYNNIGTIYYEQNNYKKALETHFYSLKIAKEINNKRGQAISYGNIGITYNELGNYDEALKNHFMSLKINEDIDNKKGICYSNNAMANTYINKKNYSEALIYSNKALEIAKDIGMKSYMLESYITLSISYSKLANYKKAYEYQVLSSLLKDTLLNETNNKNIAEIQALYNTEKKEKEIIQLKTDQEKKNSRKNLLLLSLISILIVIGLGALFFYRNYKQTQSIRELEKNELKQKVLLSQMSPHFIFNSISNIKGLIRNKDDARAMNYLDEFSLLTRQVLEHSRENYISLEEECSMITNYLNIQQLLLNNSFVYELHVSENINKEATFIPPMLTQPFIENAIKHGAREGIKGNVEIQFILDTQNKLLVSVKDNGKGFSDKQTQTEHKSLALKITKQRLEQYNANSTIVFENVISEKGAILGAKISFEMPYIYEG